MNAIVPRLADLRTAPHPLLLCPFLILGMLLGAAGPAQAETPSAPLTYRDLVSRLTDLQYLATLPDPGQTTAQWSSYDRASKYDQKSGKYVRWDANGDGDGIIRKENGKLVLAEMNGPGCIWRIWSAAPKEGHVRIYLDGNSEPAVDLPFAAYFDRQNEPFTRPALVHTVARGSNNYTPIPYQKSCKIVADPGWGSYYHFGYSTFPKGTQVPTFKRSLSAEDNAALDAANRILSDCGPFAGPFAEPQGQERLDKLPFEEIRSGGQLDLKPEGPAAITSIRIKLDGIPQATADRDALRALTLEIYWDGEKSPSVWAPFGDFFGTAPGSNPYRSMPCGLTTDGWWYCHWFMPFASGAEIRLRNRNPFAVKAKLGLDIRPLPADAAANYARFHAKWHRDEFLPTEPERQIDWPLLETSGRGRFVGVMLHVWNPRGGWWGEGDEKFFVDGEKFPSTFGTGSEDYFGYAWSSPELFEHAYHNQTHNDGWSRGHISVNRWQIPDAVPFAKNFEGCIEKYFPNERPTLYAATVYWYLAPGGQDPYMPVPLEDRIGYYSSPPPPRRAPGALEGESLQVLSKTGGTSQTQDMVGFGGDWSNDAQLWWTGAKPGDKLELALPVAQTGNYTVHACFTRAIDYGIVQLYLDGRKLGGPIDLYHAGVVTAQMDLGTLVLAEGGHKLAVEMMGANPAAVPSYMFGLDYVRLQAAQ